MGNGDSPELSYERVALLGLLACQAGAEGLTVDHFVEIATLAVPELANMEPLTPEREEIRSFWRAAHIVMCPS
jgi:hypothetical protein